MRRNASYSDSFIILGRSRDTDENNILTPILVPIDHTDETQNASVNQIPEISPEEKRIPYKPKRTGSVLCFLFIFKGSLHIFLISAFETLFYFLYVNKSENEGIISTINTYYKPLVENCATTWSNDTRAFIQYLFQNELNKTNIDILGDTTREQRAEYNEKLLLASVFYSVFCFGLCILTILVVKWKRWIVPWRRIILENVFFVFILGIYEVFFFRTIIYNYTTISTAEINQRIVDGLDTCASN
jgi:hypothetical protein